MSVVVGTFIRSSRYAFLLMSIAKYQNYVSVDPPGINGTRPSVVVSLVRQID